VTNSTLFLPTRLPQHLRYRGLASRDETKFRLPNLETELGWERFVTPSQSLDTGMSHYDGKTQTLIGKN
jgi:hypothetical protein